MYSKAAKKVIRIYLRDHFPHNQADQYHKLTDRQYRKFLEDLPNLGGKKNSQAQSVYDCIALFSLYEVLPEKPAAGVFEELVNQLFAPAYRKIAFANMNRPTLQKLSAKIFAYLSRKGKAHAAEWKGNYCMHAEPYDPEVGVRFRFTFCPIADFAKKHGYSHLMPAMCNPDYPTLQSIHASLIRSKVCATDDCCDYWIVGDESPLLKQHPLYRDDQGFLRNQ